MKPDASVVDTLQAFPFFNSAPVLDCLKQELPIYMAKAASVAADFALNHLPGGRIMLVTCQTGPVQLVRLY